LIMPPKIAPIQLVIIPISKSKEEKATIKAQELKSLLEAKYRVFLDDREMRPGEKFYEWEKKGVPVRIEIGPKDLERQSCVLVRRDTGEKIDCPLEKIDTQLAVLLDEIQISLYEAARQRRDNVNKKVDSWDAFTSAIENGGYIFAHWCEDSVCEAKIKEKTKAVTRCLRFDEPDEPGEHICVHCGNKTKRKRWIFAKAY